MTKKRTSNHRGGLNSVPTAPPQDTQFTNAGSASTLGTSEPTVQPSQTYQDIAPLLTLSPNAENLSTNALASRMLAAFANQLERAGLVEWRHVTLKDQRAGWVLFFDADNWVKNGSELLPR